MRQRTFCIELCKDATELFIRSGNIKRESVFFQRSNHAITRKHRRSSYYGCRADPIYTNRWCKGDGEFAHEVVYRSFAYVVSLATAFGDNSIGRTDKHHTRVRALLFKQGRHFFQQAMVRRDVDVKRQSPLRVRNLTILRRWKNGSSVHENVQATVSGNHLMQGAPYGFSFAYINRYCKSCFLTGNLLGFCSYSFC